MKSERGMSSMAMLSRGGGIPVRQTQLTPDGLEFSEDVTGGRWVEEGFSDWKLGKVGSLMPAGFSAYARIFHPAYLHGDREQPVRWSTVASWDRADRSFPDAVCTCRWPS